MNNYFNNQQMDDEIIVISQNENCILDQSMNLHDIQNKEKYFGKFKINISEINEHQLMSNEDINCNKLSDYESDNESYDESDYESDNESYDESDNESDYESDYESDNESDNKSELSDTELYEDNVWSTIDSYLPYVIILGGIVYAIKLFYYRK